MYCAGISTGKVILGKVDDIDAGDILNLGSQGAWRKPKNIAKASEPAQLTLWDHVQSWLDTLMPKRDEDVPGSDEMLRPRVGAAARRTGHVSTGS